MAVRHVLAQADIRDDEQLRQFLLQEPHRLLDDSFVRVGAGGLGIFRRPECRTAAPPAPPPRGPRRPRAPVHRVKAGKRRAWRRWAGAISVPLRTNSGSTNCPACSRVSLTISRKTGDCRSRRGRYSGKPSHKTQAHAHSLGAAERQASVALPRGPEALGGHGVGREAWRRMTPGPRRVPLRL